MISIVIAGQIVVIIASKHNEAALRAMGGTVGTFAGALAALLFIVLYYIKKRNVISNKIYTSYTDGKKIFLRLVSIMIPIILSQTIYQIGYTIDDYLFADIMKNKGWGDVYITDLQGVFNTQYTQMINLPIGMATAFGVSVIPRITASYKTKKKLEMSKNIEQLIGMTSVVVLPATIGLTICADEIMSVLFPNLGEMYTIAVKLLAYGSVSAILYSFSTISTSILQGCNYFKIPVINSALSLGVHVIIVASLIKYTELQTYALLIGDMIFPLLILVFNVCVIIKKIKPQVDWKKSVVTPLLGAMLMGGAVLVLRMTANYFGIASLWKLALEVIVGIAVYGIYVKLFVIKRK